MRAPVRARRALAVLVVACAAGTVRAAGEEVGLPATIDRIRPAIVAVGTSEPTRNPPYQFRGTGFVVGDGTLVATNAHVVPVSTDAANREVVSVAIPQPGGDAIVRPATVVGRDAEHDLALLKVSGPPLPAVRLGDSARVREGQAFAFTGFRSAASSDSSRPRITRSCRRSRRSRCRRRPRARSTRR